VPTTEELRRRFERALESMQGPAEEIDGQLETTEGVEEEASYEPPPTSINVFQHPDAHPAILDMLLFKRYGRDWLGWEGETIEWRIPQDFNTPDVGDLAMHKIEAMRTLHVNANFWTRWEVFLWLTMPLNDLYPDFVVMQVPTLAQCLVSTEIADSVHLNHEWSQELRDYLGVVYRHDGIFCPVWPLEEIEIDVPDLVDQEAILKRWPEVSKSRVAPTEDTVEGEQLRRMLRATEHLEESRDRFKDQLPLVKHA